MKSNLDPQTYQLDIYRQAWGAERIPFAEEDSIQLYQSSQHERILQSLHQSAALRTTMLLSGESGSGKSAMLGSWARQLAPKQWRPLIITQSTVSGSGLLSLLLEQLGGEPGLGRSKNLPRIEKALTQLGDITPIIILDEAQQYHNDALEEMRLLQGLNLSRQRHFATILAGDNHFLSRLRLQSHRALLSRIAISEQLEKLNQEQSHHYLQHHLEKAQLSKEAIESEAIELISAASDGNPRVLKNLSRAAWISASEAERTQITGEDVRRALPRVPSAISA
jgi:general secretion pathway protein A